MANIADTDDRPGDGRTLEAHLDMLRIIRNSAIKDKKYSMAVEAEVARARAVGLYSDNLQKDDIEEA